MSEAEKLVEEAAERGIILSLAVAELAPKRVLEILGEGGHSHRLTLQSSTGSITVEVGNGVVVGATADLTSGERSGREAYAAIRSIREGTMRIEPLRFPSLANILEPVARLIDLGAATIPPVPVSGEDTIELSLPEARPIHPPPRLEPATVEMELPDDIEEQIIAPPARVSEPPPIPVVALAEAEAPATVVVELPPVQRRRSHVAYVAIAAAALLGVAGAFWALAPSSGEAAPDEPRASASTPSEAPVPVVAETSDEVDMDLTEDVAAGESRTEARQLARTARRSLRAGDGPAALSAARRAAELRGGLPYYQVLLGDALRANGERRAARRAYRRAVRLRPGYAPAVRRLGRQRAAARRTQPAPHT